MTITPPACRPRRAAFTLVAGEVPSNRRPAASTAAGDVLDDDPWHLNAGPMAALVVPRNLERVLTDPVGRR